MKKKEKLILSVITDGSEGIKKTKKNHEEMIKEYKENGFGDMHPGNIESYKEGLNYTLGYTIGHIELLKQVKSLLKMTSSEIEELILKNKKIEKGNKKRMKKIFDEIKSKSIK